MNTHGITTPNTGSKVIARLLVSGRSVPDECGSVGPIGRHRPAVAGVTGQPPGLGAHGRGADAHAAVGQADDDAGAVGRGGAVRVAGRLVRVGPDLEAGLVGGAG